MLGNPSGSVSSPWVGFRTLEASPGGLGNFTVEQREQGRALLLSWDQPPAPNGVITVHDFCYIITAVLFLRLNDFTYIFDKMKPLCAQDFIL